MATALENLTTARDNICARLAEVTASARPNYSIDGETVSHADYIDMLNRQLETVNKQIQAMGSPFMVIMRGRT